MNRGSVSRAAAARDVGGIHQSWPNRYAVTVTAALLAALSLVVPIGLSGTASADTRNLTSTVDTQISENSTAANYGDATTLKVDGDDPGGSGKDAYSLLRWDLSSVPAGSEVDSASVTVNVTNPSTQTYQIYDLKRPWVESAATWLQYASGGAWEVAGAKGSLDRGSQVGSLSAPTTGTRTVSLSPALVQRWLDNPASNQGIIIANATNSDGVDFYSRQVGDASLRPTLSMNYSGTTTPPSSRYLSDMNWTSATSAWGPVEKDVSNGEQAAGDGHTITLNGTGFQKGLGVHAASDVRYNLAGAYSTFSAKVGVDDEVGTRGSVVFEVWADGTRLYSSGVMNGASTAEDVLLDVRGKNELRLVVTNASDGSDFDHADWAEAMVDNSSPPTTPDTDGDGVKDDVDKCVNESGPASNNGCPVVEQPPPTGSGGDPVVFAHWHHDAQRAVSGANTLSAYTQEIQKAKAMGVDAFAVNTVNWQSVQQTEIGTLYNAAEQYNAAHPGDKFFLFPSADQCCSMNESTLDSYMTFRYDSPARLRVDGGRYGNDLPVAQTWHGEAKGPLEWKRIQNEWAASGKPMYFIPYFDKGPYSGSYSQLVDTYNGSNNSDPSDDVVDGLFNFGGIASGNNSEAGLQSNAGLDSAVDASPGMDAMAGCAPHFNRHSDSGQYGNRIIGDFEGYHAWLSCLQGLQTQKPRFVEFVTWSDYLEGSYLGGPYSNTQLWPTYRGNNLSHDAFRKLGAYYDEWFQSGTKPAIRRDLIAIAHRLHPEDATGVNLNGAGILDDTDLALNDSSQVRPMVRQTDYSVVEDRLYAAVMLTQPGQVRLSSGTSSQTFDVPAGVTEVSMPFAVGTQKIELLRGGNVVLTATSARQVLPGPVDLFNYNVETTYAEGP